MVSYRKKPTSKIFITYMKDILSKTKLFVKKVQASGIKVNHAFLFGSYAKGKAKSYSDIDVCIVSPNLGHDFIEEMVKLNTISHRVDSRIEAIPFNEERLNDPYDPLAFEIRKNSISLK